MNINNRGPLVSVIIPTYNRPHLFEIALKSVLNQTYKNIEIFISDNSSNMETKKIMAKYMQQYSNIIYEYHPEYTCELDNWNRCRSYDNPEAEYVNWLMDDDVFVPEKIEIMLKQFTLYPNLSIVTSYRQCIDIDGNILPDSSITRPIGKHNFVISGETAGKIMLTTMINYIGEPTTPLIKKSAMINGTLGSSSNDKDGYFTSDFPTWLTVLQTGNLLYLTKPLSMFRLYSGQTQRNISTMITGLMCWGREICYYWQNKIFLKEADDYIKASNIWIGKLDDMSKICNSIDYNIEDKLSDMINISQKIMYYKQCIDDKCYKKKCSCCGVVIDRYLPISEYYKHQRLMYGAVDIPIPEMVNSDEYTCPNCGAADRERAYAIWMKRELPRNKLFTFLDVAPALSLQRFIKSTFPMINYKTGDLFMDHVDYKLDVMNMYQIPDNSVDFFICSHVLEHVRDDIRAMREFNRILSPTGKGILIVPINLAVTEIDEDPDCTDIGERWRRFDQDDHVRRYSKQGYIQRLKSVFNVEIYDRNYFGKEAMYENGLLDTSTLYVVRKK